MTSCERQRPIMFVAGLSLAALLLPGCTQVLGIEDLPARNPGGGDGGPADGGPADGPEPTSFRLVGAEPSVVREGDGAVRPIPIVIEGQNISPDVEVAVGGPNGLSTTDVVVSADGTRLAFGLSVPVIEGAAPETVTVLATQGQNSALVNLPLRSLDELVASQIAGGRLSQNDIADLYSRIVIDTSLILEGTEPVRLVATAEVVVAASISADGGDAVGATPGDPGPGGCRGGGLSEDGECGSGGGLAPSDPTSNDSAGGGGHITPGIPGGGDNGADGGSATGTAALVPLDDEGGNGGGGSKQGSGGAGGGVLELTSEGSFTLDVTALFSARGGRGGDGRCDAVSVGGAGGGSGGAILLRGLGGFADLGTSVRMDASGGAGGDTDTCLENGGGGADGRMRVDHPEPGEFPPFARTTRRPIRGPVISPTLPTIVDTSGVVVPLFGQPSEVYQVFVNGSRFIGVEIDADGAVNVPVTLVPGRNLVCASVDSAPIELQPSEAYHCLPIAYIPTTP
ncbi:hypothetical protein [Haliangium sp.]|uniref:hypothetical protein n=1 Tax=Haliangium sp. TaxID=2663208 RepID=UPI003D0FF59B